MAVFSFIRRVAAGTCGQHRVALKLKGRTELKRRKIFVCKVKSVPLQAWNGPEGS